jgi:uncharacterized membrane protein
MVARLKNVVGSDDAIDDVIVARVRSAIGRWVTHPGSIAVAAHDGRVTLDGPVLASEANSLLSAVVRVRGVREVENRLSLHDHPGAIPGLQGGGPARRARAAYAQSNWSPTVRLLAGSGGLALMAWGARQRPPIAIASAAGGAVVLARSLLNIETRRVLGLSGRRSVDVQKTIHIGAPVQEVFRIWQRYEDFPRFMTHVRNVRDLGNGRSRWTVDGPGGTPVQWDAEVTKLVPNEEIAWKSVAGSAIGHAGVVRFEPTSDSATRLTIRLSYNPPAGVAGHGVARLFGADPKRQLDDDIVRLKTMIETGTLPRDAAQPAPRPERVETSGV